MRTACIVTSALIAALSAGCGKSAPSTPTDVGADAPGDKLKLKGVWKIDAFESPAGDRGPREEEIKNFRVVFDGGSMRIVDRGSRGYEEKFAIALDTTRDPKVLTLTGLDDDGQPRQRYGSGRGESNIDRQEWIYKFDGDTLVIAFRQGSSGGRPTEFKPQAGSSGGGYGTAKYNTAPARPATSRAGTPAYSGTSGYSYRDYVGPVIVLKLTKTDEPVPAEIKRPRYGTSFGTFRGTQPYSGTAYRPGTQRYATKK